MIIQQAYTDIKKKIKGHRGAKNLIRGRLGNAAVLFFCVARLEIFSLSKTI
jgi:hypothetical protein